ncbi:hypothetical protein [Pseudoalteromonas phenolica]|uniref:hypothetical protein n=1 Tax=Pseudoalteromonas phenolica TaxID=161398 RepID=UPI00110A6AB8|nr:hypothetical protein [Pseudoalteromonas phenolica]TMO57916.1 hypothetical protein CWC21_01275 [Pseudoalteromonas phenolica]
MNKLLFGLSAMLSVSLLGCQTTDTATLDETQWRYATDPHGSQAILNGSLVTTEHVEIAFKRVPRVDKLNNSWVELIYDLPNKQLPEQASITLTYQSDKDMIIKLSQKDYGGDGDKTYAHYQTALPAANVWTTQTVTLNDFQRPSWTPASSTDKGIITEHVSALYFVPKLTDAQGGEAFIKIKNVNIK